jgi:4-amino-4-deoxy-L-arabinose transferase-like glycosyltransferase
MAAAAAAIVSAQRLLPIARPRVASGRRGVSRLRRIPTPAWIALVACVNAVCWSVISPPFEVADETAHFGYVKQLAETGRLPHTGVGSIPREVAIALTDLRVFKLSEDAAGGTVASVAEQQRLERAVARAAQLPREGSETAGVASSEPPLYYALEAIPYRLAFNSSILVRLTLMRLLSALLGGLTALFVYLFVREALPAEPWAWTPAGLAVALLPLLGMLSGAVTPDALLFAVCAAVFFLFAKAFRRGLSRALAACIGAAIAVGLLTKLNFIALLPGCLAGLLVLGARVGRTSKRDACGRLALACAIAVSPLAAALIAGRLTPHIGVHILSSSLAGLSHHGSIPAKLEYLWQLYLPRLPGMSSDFPGLSTIRQIWLNGFVGVYTWANIAFPTWVDLLALIPTAAIAALCARTLVLRRDALRARTLELCVYALIAAGVLVSIAILSYSTFPGIGAQFGRVRYLFPLLALLGAVLALAARGAGRRWGPAVGALIVVLVLAQNLLTQLLFVSRYYG